MNRRPDTPYRLIAFDFDGTLADTYPWFESIWSKIAAEHGFRVPSRDESQELKQLDAHQVMRALGVPLWKAPALLIRLRKEMADVSPDISLFEGVPEMLRALSGAGVTLALLSSNAEDNARRILGQAHSALFSEFECGTSLFGKAAKIKHLLNRTGHTADQILLIGDEIRDIEAARTAGIAVGSVVWGYNDRTALAARQPDLLLETPAHIVRAVLHRD